MRMSSSVPSLRSLPLEMTVTSRSLHSMRHGSPQGRVARAHLAVGGEPCAHALRARSRSSASALTKSATVGQSVVSCSSHQALTAIRTERAFVAAFLRLVPSTCENAVSATPAEIKVMIATTISTSTSVTPRRARRPQCPCRIMGTHEQVACRSAIRRDPARVDHRFDKLSNGRGGGSV